MMARYHVTETLYLGHLIVQVTLTNQQGGPWALETQNSFQSCGFVGQKDFFLHEKGHRSDDPTSVKGMMKHSLIGVFHCCINDDPPTSKKLQQTQIQTCM